MTASPVPFGSPFTGASFEPFSLAETTGLMDCPPANARAGSTRVATASARTLPMTLLSSLTPDTVPAVPIRARKPCGRLNPGTRPLEGIRRERPRGRRVPETEREAERSQHRNRGSCDGSHRAGGEREAEADRDDGHRNGREESEKHERRNGA